jgi:hypothetical protein
MAAIVAAIGLPRPASNRTTVLMPTLALSAKSFTVQSSAARAILHCMDVISGRNSPRQRLDASKI